MRTEWYRYFSTLKIQRSEFSNFSFPEFSGPSSIVMSHQLNLDFELNDLKWPSSANIHSYDLTYQ